MTRDELKALRELAEKSTRVVSWYPHSPDSGCLDWTVRGPFHRWLRVTLVEERYQGNVAPCENDAKFAAAAMNNLVPLLDEIDRLWDAIRSTIARADDYGDSHVTRPIRDLPYTRPASTQRVDAENPRCMNGHDLIVWDEDPCPTCDTQMVTEEGDKK